MGPRVQPWAAAAILLLLGDTAAAEDLEDGEALQVQIVYLNFETVQVTWNDTGPAAGSNLSFFYRYREDEPLLPCPRYVLQRGRTAGCLMDGVDFVLQLELHDGARPVLRMQRWLADYLRLSSPQDLRFVWAPDAVTMLCHTLPHPGLLYEVQHRTPYDGDTEWQSTVVAKVCNVTIEGLDMEHCHLFRARVRTAVPEYSPDIPPGDWTQVARWRGAAPQDSCLQPLDRLWPRWTRFLLVCSLLSLLSVALLVIGLWKAQGVKRLLMPTVPDPSSSFSGLFEQHQGDFQEWITDTQHVAPCRRAPPGEHESAAEQTLEVQLCVMDAQLPAAPPPRQEEVPPPQAGSLVSLGGFAFVVMDSAYMKL